VSRRVRIYVLFHEGLFRDVFASYSEAYRVSHGPPCCRIETFDREDY
jgi:hypothetical protein